MSIIKAFQQVKHNAHPDYRPDIDGLRAIAIIPVVTFHAFPGLLQGGFVGVDIFFVISGFLISSIIFKREQRGDFSFSEFYAHRIKRIFPALIVVLTACYVFGWFVLLPPEFMQLGKHIAAGAGFVQNVILWQEVGYFDRAAELKPLLHIWSLAIEEQFYLLYPVLAVVAWRLGVNVLTALILLSVVSFGLNMSALTADPAAAFFMPQTRFWELLAGSVLAYLQVFSREKLFARMLPWVFHPLLFSRPPQATRRSEALNNILSVVGVICLIAAMCFINKSTPFPGWRALLPVSGAFLIILAGSDAWVNRNILSNRLMVFVGLISYPLYLWHWPILSFARIIKNEIPSQGIRIGAVVLSVALAWLTYRMIERPIRFGKTIWIKTLILPITLAVVGYVGYDTFRKSGLAFRIPKEVRHIADFQYDYHKGARVGTCWLQIPDAPDGFGAECIEVPRSAKSHSVVVWGDSHAARLYLGLRATLGEDVAISQLTRDNCPPLLNSGYDVCKKSNAHVIASVQVNQPTTVVMFAVWGSYQSDWVNSDERDRLLETVRMLKQLGRNIIVLGPAPYWKGDLPKLLYEDWQRSFPRRIAERLAVDMMTPEPRKVDEAFEELFRKEQVRYVSILKMLCNDSGCLTHVPGKPDALLSWDYGHLTTDGATFVAQQLLSMGILP